MYPSVYHRFFENYSLLPNNIAINCNGNNYTYRELAQIVSDIRLQIKDKNHLLIGVVTGDDVFTYASILAILSMGSGYVPISHLNPMKRNTEIINDAGLKIILTSKVAKVIDNDSIQITLTTQLLKSNLDISPCCPMENGLAYLLFTSGSTGKPKGVPIKHSNLNAFMRSIVDEKLYDFTSSDRFIQIFDLAFDLSVFSFLVPLSVGASCYVVPEKGVHYLQIIKCLEEQKITIALLLPSILNYLKPYFNEISLPALRYNLFCGEALYENLLDQWYKCVPHSIIQNVYGPTEATIFCTTYQCGGKGSKNATVNGIVSIGKPIGEMKILIVNEKNEIRSNGEIGELCLSGYQVTDKYWLDQGKTAKSFINITFLGAKLLCYKTGDLCYLDHKNNLIYCGRSDCQVKIHGYRVELPEIEFHTRNYYVTHNTVATSTLDKNGIECIVLFVERLPEDKVKLINYLKQKLPPYMIPNDVKFIEKFPLNLNGKIDKNKLKAILNNRDHFITYRKGTIKDINFIANAIIEAEKSGNSFTLYERVFDLDEGELIEFITKALLENLDGCELSYNAFTLAESDNNLIGCIAGWIEGEGIGSSNNIKAFLISRLLGINKWKSIQEKLKTISLFNIPRTSGALQLESGYVSENYRRKRIFQDLIDYTIKKQNFSDCLKVQILSGIRNDYSYYSFENSGFNAVQKKYLTDDKLFVLFPGRGRILWEKSVFYK